MVGEQNLDVRTVTMAISLTDCISDDGKRCADKIYDKIAKYAEKLVPVASEIESEFGIPIVNKRVSVTPVSVVGAGSGDYLRIASALDRAAKDTGVDFIGGYSALVHKDLTERLPRIRPALYRRVRALLDLNKAERHIRGGLATRRKYKGE